MKHLPGLLIIATILASGVVLDSFAEQPENKGELSAPTHEVSTFPLTPALTVPSVKKLPVSPLKPSCQSEDIQSMIDSLLATGKMYVPANLNPSYDSKNKPLTSQEVKTKNEKNQPPKQTDAGKTTQSGEGQKASFMIFLNKLQRVISFSTGIG